jgi:DNA-binding winged helix-turn-helix (wHTH) protein
MRITFGAFVLDGDSRQLTRAGREIHLTPKAFEVLVALAEARPNVLSKVELQQRLWPETFVAEANLSNLVAEVREALEDVARSPLFIRTAHGFGYAFCGVAADVKRGLRSETAGPACWLEWGGHRFPLAPGENVIGRDADLEVRLEGTTVSRTSDGDGLGYRSGRHRQQERHVSRRGSRHRTGATHGWGCHPHRFIAHHLPRPGPGRFNGNAGDGGAAVEDSPSACRPTFAGMTVTTPLLAASTYPSSAKYRNS